MLRTFLQGVYDNVLAPLLFDYESTKEAVIERSSATNPAIKHLLASRNLSPNVMAASLALYSQLAAWRLILDKQQGSDARKIIKTLDELDSKIDELVELEEEEEILNEVAQGKIAGDVLQFNDFIQAWRQLDALCQYEVEAEEQDSWEREVADATVKMLDLLNEKMRILRYADYVPDERKNVVMAALKEGCSFVRMMAVPDSKNYRMPQTHRGLFLDFLALRDSNNSSNVHPSVKSKEEPLRHAQEHSLLSRCRGVPVADTVETSAGMQRRA